VTADAVFLDTVGLLALWDRSDQWHADAERAFAGLSKEGASLITTAYVLLECGNSASRRPYRAEADALREQLEAGELLIWPTAEDWRTAWAAYRRGEADQAGVVDHVSFVVMRRLGLTRAFTNDRHFRAAGFLPLF
jgi:uncharacterized protein